VLLVKLMLADDAHGDLPEGGESITPSALPSSSARLP
jgi:hypothetical protein